MSTFRKKTNIVLEEISSVLSKVSKKEVENFVNLFSKYIKPTNRKIVVAGAGRMGYAAKGFAMRLGHLNFPAWTLGDSTVPYIGCNDLLIITSGSGNTQTILDISQRAYENGAQIALITNNPDSKIGKLATTILVLPNNSNESVNKRNSIQPMSTLNEQSLAILLDTIILEIMDSQKETHETMLARHSNLE